MEAGASPSPVVTWLEGEGLELDHISNPPKGVGWLDRWHGKVPDIYVVHTFGPNELMGGMVYAVVPAHLAITVRNVTGVSHLLDGEGSLPR